MTGDTTTARASGLDFERLFRAAPAASIVTDADDTILDVSDAFTTWTGHDRADVIGSSFLALLPIADRILFATRTRPLLELGTRLPEIALTILGRDRTPLSTALVAAQVATDPIMTMFTMGPRRARSSEEEQLISALHRAEDSDSRRQSAEDSLTHLTNHDELTGLLNRAGLVAALVDTIAGQEIGVYWIGCDYLRVVNDSLGRTAGDMILTAIAERLTDHYAGQVALARVGGDEFAVAARGPGSGDQARTILELVAEPVTFEGLEIVTTASVGVATHHAFPATASQALYAAEALLRTAGTGMYEAKAAGRNRWKQVDEIADDTVVNEIRLLGEIRAGIVDDQFRLDYQPQLDLRTRRLHGFEALMRWDHPERGVIGPDGFIDVAEKTGLISQLGTWACSTAVAQAIALSAASGTPVHMSVNISARQLGDSHFAEAIESLLSTCGFDPVQLTLELTETSLITDAPNARNNLERLHNLGVRLSIDDFGTGHAGFSYLTDFDIDEIKIDRTFIDQLDRSPEATAIIVSCIELAHALDVIVVAEGVETAAQLSRLAELGCDVVQGYHYSRPLHTDALENWTSPLEFS